MGVNTKEVGGGPSTGLANDFVKFLQGGLNTGTFGGQPVPSQQTTPSKFQQFIANSPAGKRLLGSPKGPTTPQSAFANANPVQSTQGVAGYLNNALNGQPAPFDYGADLTGMQELAGNMKPFDFGNFNPNLADFGSFQNPLGNFNAQNQTINAPGSIYGNQGLQGYLSGLTNLANQSTQDQFDLSKQFGTASALGPAATVTLDRPDLSYMDARLDRDRAKTLGDIRARFGASGGAAFGTPAAFAEANAAAEIGAQNAATLGQLGMQAQGLGLQRDALNSQNYNQFANNSLQAQLANQGLNANMFSNLLGNQLGALQAGGQLSLNALGQDAGNQLAAAQSNAANNLQAQGLNLNALTNKGQLDLDALRGQSTQGIQEQGLRNDFLGMQANNQLNSQANLGNLLNMIANNQLQGNQLNMNQGQFNQSQQQNLIQNLMSLFQNMSMPGIAQRQVVQSPSFGASLLGGVTGLAGAAAPFLAPGLGSVGGILPRPNIGPIGAPPQIAPIPINIQQRR